jgi:YVTN family beta-propeller protein
VSAAIGIALLGTAAVAAAAGEPWPSGKVGANNGQGVLLPTGQRINPVGTRLLVRQGRIPSSAISPNGEYMAALSWNDFSGFLTMIDLQTGKIVQQVGIYPAQMGDGTVAADGPLWSADGETLWVPQTADLLKFHVFADGHVGPSPVNISLTETIENLTTGPTTVPDLPSGMALSTDGSKLYVALNGVNQLGAIDTTTNQLIQVIPVGNAPRQVVIVGSRAFVSNEGGTPAKPGQYTNISDGTNIVANKVTGAASTGTVSVVNLATGKEAKEIPVGLEPTAEYLAPDGTLMVANSNDDSMSFIDTATDAVTQTVNVNPLPGSTVGSYPNAITMPNPTTILVSIGRDNAIAVYNYVDGTSPVSYEGLLPTDFYPVNVALDSAIGKIVVTNDKGIGSRGPESTINKGPGTNPATGHNTYDDTGSVTTFAMPTMAQLASDTSQVFYLNGWDHLLASTPISDPTATPVAIPAKLGNPSTIKHVFLIIRENRTYDQVFGDIGKGNSDPALAQFGAPVTPNAHAIANQFGLFDNFYDEGTLSADGHNWIVQADANDYIEKEFGAFYRSYPAQGGDALAYQRDGFLWNAAESAGQTVQAFGEYNNYLLQGAPASGTSTTYSWMQYYQDSQILEPGHRAAAGAALLGPHVRGHSFAQRDRLHRVPAVRPEHPRPVPGRRLDAGLRQGRSDGAAAEPVADLGPGRPYRHRGPQPGGTGGGQRPGHRPDNRRHLALPVLAVLCDIRDGGRHPERCRPRRRPPRPADGGEPVRRARRRQQHVLQPAERREDGRADPRHRPDEPGGPRGRADVQRVHQHAQLHPVHLPAQPGVPHLRDARWLHVGVPVQLGTCGSRRCQRRHRAGVGPRDLRAMGGLAGRPALRRPPPDGGLRQPGAAQQVGLVREPRLEGPLPG